MPELSPESLVVGLGILLALWYLGASMFNRRRGIAIYRWLHSQIDRFGGEVSGRWIGSSGSGAEITIRKANEPFKELQLIYLLASRELLPLFLVDLLRGKRDRLIIRATLRDPLPGEVNAAPASSRQGRRLQADAESRSMLKEGPQGLTVLTEGTNADRLYSALEPFLQKYGAELEQLSWSKKAPQLIAIVRLGGLIQKEGPAELYADLEAAARAASR